MASIPDGIYDVVGDSIRVLATSDVSAQELQRLAGVFSRLREQGASAQEIKDAVRDEAPALLSVIDSQFRPRNPADWYALVTLILTILALLLSHPNKDALTAEDVERLSRSIIEQTIEESRQQPAPTIRVRKPPPPPPRKVQAQRKRAKRRP